MEMRRLVVGVTLVSAALVGFALPTIAEAAGLAQVDIANDPWVLALLSLLGIGGVASIVGSALDRVAQVLGVTTDALLWLLCLGLAGVVLVVRGGAPVWGGDPAGFVDALVELTIAARAGASVVYGLFLARLRPVQDAKAPEVGRPA